MNNKVMTGYMVFKNNIKTEAEMRELEEIMHNSKADNGFVKVVGGMLTGITGSLDNVSYTKAVNAGLDMDQVEAIEMYFLDPEDIDSEEAVEYYKKLTLYEHEMLDIRPVIYSHNEYMEQAGV